MGKKRRRFLFFVTVCVLLTIGYMVMQRSESATIPPKDSEIEGTVGGGGTIEGETNGDGSSVEPTETTEPTETSKPNPTETTKPPVTNKPTETEDGIAVIAQPEAVAVLVNKHNKLPDDYNPTDLVYADVRFIFKEKLDKRKMRKEAAEALKKMFDAADEDNIKLAGVSAYRSHATQTALFDRYVKKDGLEKARTYSALPGTSEHETGLSIDVSGSDGKCAASNCFGGTPEAEWLEKNAHEYGFIIRYPKGKEEITGYQYEPWHIRFVGTEISTEINQTGQSLEEYFDAIPVSN